MKFDKFFPVVLALVLVSTQVFAAQPHQDAASDHAPIGVMGDHIHEKGEWMTSYRYMRMEMEGLRSQVSEVNQQDAIADSRYVVSPRFMLSDKHIFGVMYGISDSLTGSLMIPFISQSMSHNHQSSQVNHFRRGFQGFGDLQASGIYQSIKTPTYELLLNAGVSVPVGTVTADDKGPLAYPMQLGSGTIDFLPGFTVKGTLPNPRQTWGSQFSAVLRSGYNTQGYRLGNQYKMTGWLANDITDSLSGSLRLT
ncbi:MAG: transporter, partial [bacterium]|nr:transporter [bacterium]